jgi:signal transduction histidine kinase
MNLVSNAIKFTPAGKKVTLTADKVQDWVRFQVIDEGIGISDEQKYKIFEPFVQADIGTSREFGGTGLGLALVKNLVELLGGNVSVQSEQNVGSIFTCFVPLVEADTDLLSSA